jgi:opacity protein-like surface antigen
MRVRLLHPTLLTCIVTLFVARVAAADQQWEVEAHGGFGASTHPTSGIALLGEASLPTSAVPSWYFGDGAQLLAQFVSGPFRPVSAALAPLDSTLQSAFAERRSGGGFGVRVGRTLTPRYSLEFSVDQGFGRSRVSDASRAALDRASAGFTSAFNALLSFPSRQSSVGSVVAVDEGRGRELVTTGALSIHFARRARLNPYATVGAGATIARGDTTTARLVGDYQFGLPLAIGLPAIGSLPPVTFHETDTVVIRVSRESSFTGVFGGGVRYALAPRWGVRLEVRDYVSPNRTTTVVTATPSADRSQALLATTIFGTFTGATLRMSTVPGIPSTLSATLSNQPTFRGTGVGHQVNVAAGLYWRF